MARKLATLSLPVVVCSLFAAACGGRRPPALPPPLPPPAAWKTLLGESVEAPLASDGRRFIVATRDGVVRALEGGTGEVAWSTEHLPGRVSAAEGTILVRANDGTLSSLHPRTGAVRWQVASAVAGEVPAVIDGDRAFVAGSGLAAVELATGRVLWSDPAGVSTAPPTPAGARVLTGESDGTLRSRDRASGATQWTLRTGQALLAPPLVDLVRQRLYLGTTEKAIAEVHLDTGKRGWSWRVGADIAQPGLLLPERIVFAAYDAVVYGLERHRRQGSRAGNLVWRAGLPSRPLSGPVVAGGYLLVACLEKDIVVFDPSGGKRLGSFPTASEIRTPPLALGGVFAVGLRDRSIVAYALPGTAPTAP